MSRRGVLALVASGVVAVLVAVGVLSGGFAGAAAAVLYRTGLWVDGGESTVPPAMFSQTPTPTPTPTPASLPPVLGPVSPGPSIDPAALTSRIDGVDRTDVGTVGGIVIDGRSGTVLYQSRADRTMIPASTMKLLTSAAVLSVLGPGHRFVTSVVSPEPGTVVLVGGGDPFLRREPDPDHPGRASLSVLAERTAEALRADDVTKVTVSYNSSVFAGPGWNPDWPDRYGDEVAATAALWVNGARTADVNPGPRDDDPPRAAAQAFVEALTEVGIEADLGESVSALANSDSDSDSNAAAEPLAEVESESLAVIVEYVLRHSDNDAAEVLFRQVSAGSGGDGSIAAAAKAVRAQLTELGVWVDGTGIVDGSGMSRSNDVSAQQVAQVVRLGLDADRPEFRSLLTGLPVAGADGSLSYRFFSPGTELGRGAVRAKTGTLTAVHSLGGYTRTDSGRVLVFAFLVNEGNAFADRVFLDRVTSAITGCGC